jgi:hypothetical protein
MSASGLPVLTVYPFDAMRLGFWKEGCETIVVQTQSLREHEGSPHSVGPMERMAYELGAVCQCKRRSKVTDAPLDDFVLLNSRPKTIGGVRLRRRRRPGLI